MSNAIVVINLPGNDDKQAMYQTSLKSIERYAEKINVPLIVVTKQKYSLNHPNVPHLEKLQAIDWLDAFDRVLCLDLDILVNPKAPNIFNAYPDGDYTYGYDEGYLPWVAEDIVLFEERFNIEFLKSTTHHGKRMLNGGVMLWSPAARAITRDFDPDKFYASFGGTAGEQSWVNAMIRKHRVITRHLEQPWNHCIYADAAYFDDRLHSHFIHYASDGHWIGKPSKVIQIQEDAHELGLL